MVFYYNFFNVGWRLPLDPFIAKFLIECDAVLSDLTLNTTRVLASYTGLCRLLAFDPSILLLTKFFIFSIKKDTKRIYVRSKPKAPRLFSAFPNKVEKWGRENSAR